VIVGRARRSAPPRGSRLGLRARRFALVSALLLGAGCASSGGVLVRRTTTQALRDDLDNDKVPDRFDKCPGQKEDPDGFEDLDGCPEPDNDGDKVPDVYDQCPLDSEDPDGFEDRDGCPDPDNDFDTIPDWLDGCPNEPEDLDGHEDLGGCPDPDNDGDGVPDGQDPCPDVAGPNGKACP
jgi:hypothetical protein